MRNIQLFKPFYRTQECLDNIKKSLDSGWTGTGPNCKEFEEKFSNMIDAKHCHYLHSCTAALHIAIRLLDLPPGSKVLTTPLTFVSTNAAIVYEGLVPVFCDVSDEFLTIDPQDAIDKAVRHNAKAIVWVHYAGMVHPMFESFVEQAKELGMVVIEDCAHAGGSFYPSGKRVGSREDTISCWSMQAVKNIPSFDGGAICVPNEEMLKRAKKLAWMGIDKDTFARTNVDANEIYKWRYDVPEIGWKYNGNDISAGIALVSLKYVDQDNAYRKQLYKWYLQEINGCGVSLAKQSDNSSHHIIVAKVKNRDTVISCLKANGVAPGVHYLPNYEFPAFKKYYQEGDCPVCEKISKQIISLPNHLGVSLDDVKFICGVIKDALKK